MNSAGLECVSQKQMYALHKVVFLALMSITLYFNEVESFAVPTMLNNTTEVPEETRDALLMGVSTTNSIMRKFNSQKHLHSSNHVHATTRTGRGALSTCVCKCAHTHGDPLCSAAVCVLACIVTLVAAVHAMRNNHCRSAEGLKLQ